MQQATEQRSVFDWTIFSIIHIILVGAISYAGVFVYGWGLGLWVAASATIAAFASVYLFAKDIPGETLMKCWLGLCVALNAAYLIHNGAKALGVQSYNDAQLKKYEIGMAEAGKAGSRRIASTLALNAKSASALEKTFADGVALIAGLLAFVELASALVIFSIGSRRLKTRAQHPQESKYPLPQYRVISQPRPPAYQESPQRAEFPDEVGK